MRMAQKIYPNTKRDMSDCKQRPFRLLNETYETSKRDLRDLSDYQKRPFRLAIEIYEIGKNYLSEYQKRHG